MASVSIRGLGKDKAATGPGGSRTPGAPRMNRILGAIDLEIADGEFLVLVGPSGCGKTTLLRCVAGLEAPSRGDLFIDGKRVTNVDPQARDIAMVFQSYALYPTMTVRENMSFALRMRRTATAEVDSLVDDAAAMLEIDHLLDRYPRELSGGQRQRVAMGRAVVRRPQVFLFDEPLSNLDAALRQQMRVELLRLHQRLRRTMIYVTHDQVEAMTLADRIAVMNRGALMQVSAPQEIYNRPQSLFVARFLGSPEMNCYPGQLRDGVFVAEGGALTVALPGEPDGDVTLGVRAEGVTLCPAEGEVPRAEVEAIEQLGWENLLHLRLGDGASALRLLCRCEAQRSPRRGETVGLRITTTQAHLFHRGGDRDGQRR